MAKLALINREAKRRATVAKFAAKRAALKAIINDATRSMDERLDARAQLEKLPRNASPVRLRNRCAITGRPRGNFRKFGLCREMIRDAAMRGFLEFFPCFFEMGSCSVAKAGVLWCHHSSLQSSGE